MSRTWRERFDTLAAKRMEEALAASIPPYTTDYERARGMLAIGNDWTRNRFGGAFYLSPLPPGGTSCSLVFVQSADGNTGAPRPSDLGGGSTDEHLIYEGLSRVAADAVLSGAGTVRGGGTVFSVWYPALVRMRASLGLPRHPVQMLATLQGIDVDRMFMLNVPDVRAIVLTVPDAAARMRHALAARPWVTLVVMPDPTSLRDAFAQLPALGVRRISCIGGRHVAANLIDAGLVDDLYLTTAPRPGGEPNTRLPAAALAGPTLVRKHGTGEDVGVVFEHRLPQRR